MTKVTYNQGDKKPRGKVLNRLNRLEGWESTSDYNGKSDIRAGEVGSVSNVRLYESLAGTGRASAKPVNTEVYYNSSKRYLNTTADKLQNLDFKKLEDRINLPDAVTPDGSIVEFKTAGSSYFERKQRYERQRSVYQMCRRSLGLPAVFGRGYGKSELRNEYLRYLINQSTNPLDRKRSLRYEIRQIMEGSNWKN